MRPRLPATGEAMSYTLRGRLETRLAVLAPTLAAACGVAALLAEWWPLEAAALFGGSWLFGQLLVHAALPLGRLSYAEDGGELGRLGPALAVSAAVVLAAAGGFAYATRPPVVHLSAGEHAGPIVLDHRQKLVGEEGTIVRGGIRVEADDVTIED